MFVKRFGFGLLMLALTGLSGCAQLVDSGAGLSVEGDSFPAPQVPDGFLFRPTFKTRQGTISAGTPFVVQLPASKRPIVVTALHLLGPAGGLRQNIAAKDISAAVSAVSLVECFNASLKVQIDGKPLAILDAAPLRTPSGAGDILAFWTSADPRIAPRALAERIPNEGEPVWLAAQLVQGTPRTRRLHRAVAIGKDKDGDFLYQFLNTAIALRATSGAPVLNSAGEVVAINVGGGRYSKQMIGIGNPVDRFRKFVEGAVKSSA